MKRFNMNEFLKFVTFLLLSLFLFNLTSTGNIKLFIAPRIIIYVNIFQVALAILTFYQLIKSFTIASNRPINKSLVLFIIMILIGKGAANAGFDATTVDQKGVKAINKIANVAGKPTEDEKKKNLPLDVSEKNFVSLLGDITNNPNDYNGRTITLRGFVHKDSTLDQNEFVIGRLFVGCCVADSILIGPIGRLPKDTPIPEENTWIEVTGKLTSKSYSFDNQLTTSPVVVIDSIQGIPAPKDPYVYTN